MTQMISRDFTSFLLTANRWTIFTQEFNRHSGGKQGFVSNIRKDLFRTFVCFLSHVLFAQFTWQEYNLKIAEFSKMSNPVHKFFNVSGHYQPRCLVCIFTLYLEHINPSFVSDCLFLNMNEMGIFIGNMWHTNVLVNTFLELMIWW